MVVLQSELEWQDPPSFSNKIKQRNQSIHGEFDREKREESAFYIFTSQSLNEKLFSDLEFRESCSRCAG
jgi:hypothetical protein